MAGSPNSGGIDATDFLRELARVAESLNGLNLELAKDEDVAETQLLAEVRDYDSGPMFSLYVDTECSDGSAIMRALNVLLHEDRLVAEASVARIDERGYRSERDVSALLEQGSVHQTLSDLVKFVTGIPED